METIIRHRATQATTSKKQSMSQRRNSSTIKSYTKSSWIWSTPATVITMTKRTQMKKREPEMVKRKSTTKNHLRHTTSTQRPWLSIRPHRRRSQRPTPRLDQTDTQYKCPIGTSIKSRTTVRRTTCHSLKNMTSTKTTPRPTCRSISKQRQQLEIIKRQVWVRCSVEGVQDLASLCYHVVLAKRSLASLRPHISRSQHSFFAVRTQL